MVLLPEPLVSPEAPHLLEERLDNCILLLVDQILHLFDFREVLFFLALNFVIGFLELGMAPFEFLLRVKQRFYVQAFNYVQHLELFLQHVDFFFKKLVLIFELLDFRELLDFILSDFLDII